MIVIEVIGYKGQPVEGTVRARFDSAGGTIGRAPGSTLLLPDARRHISRTHAVVELKEGRFLLHDQGTAVPVIVNGRPVGRGNTQAIASGDELQIGDCTLRVTAASAGDADPSLDDATVVRSGAWTPSEQAATVLPDGVDEATVPVDDPLGDASGAPAHTAGSALSPGGGPITQPGSQEDELLAALLRGAGVSGIRVAGGLTPQLMEDVGAVMRETVRGLLDLLAARAQAKREVRADATVEMARHNNPLKFAPSPEAAMAHLLTPRERLFMPPLESLIDAHEGLRTHHEGFVAGMRAALAGVLARFDPAKLEAQLMAGEGRGALLPVSHKAKLWARYEAFYGDLSREAASDFHDLLGEDFLRAYQARTRHAATGEGPEDAV